MPVELPVGEGLMVEVRVGVLLGVIVWVEVAVSVAVALFVGDGLVLLLAVTDGLGVDVGEMKMRLTLGDVRIGVLSVGVESKPHL